MIIDIPQLLLEYLNTKLPRRPTFDVYCCYGAGDLRTTVLDIRRKEYRPGQSDTIVIQLLLCGTMANVWTYSRGYTFDDDTVFDLADPNSIDQLTLSILDKLQVYVTFPPR